MDAIYFISFAETGVPSRPHLAKWEPLTANYTKYLNFGDAPCAMVDVPEERLKATQALGKAFPARD